MHEAPDVGFDPAFLLDALAAVEGERVRFGFEGKSSPALFTEGAWRCVVMPVTLE